MSLCTIGLESKLKRTQVAITVSTSHLFIRLANALDWKSLYDIVAADLKSTTKKGFWNLGRRLYIRVHLAVYILQCLLKTTDREIEARINDTPVLQVFCGQSVITRWKCPDHTKVEEFRNRLSPETQQKVGIFVIKVAQSLGMADPTWMDVDSTVQEANITYPNDATLMKKLSEKVHKVIEFFTRKKNAYLPDGVIPEIEKIRKKSKEYFFLKKNAKIEARRSLFASYHKLVTNQLSPALEFLNTLNPRQINSLPWNIQYHLQQIQEFGIGYLKDVHHFVKTNTIKAGKILSFHAQAVACIPKGKAGKPREFGRVFQLGRIGGNFLIAFNCSSVRMEDKPSLMPIIQEHREIFGTGVLKEVGTDKGYYTYGNIQGANDLLINSNGIQRPVNVKTQPPAKEVRVLRDRRAGIEPLIGHAKSFGLRKSKMKSDGATLASGYRSVMGFNLHQILKHMEAV